MIKRRRGLFSKKDSAQLVARPSTVIRYVYLISFVKLSLFSVVMTVLNNCEIEIFIA